MKYKYEEVDERLLDNRHSLLDAFLMAVDLIERLDPEREHAKELNAFDKLIDKIMED